MLTNATAAITLIIAIAATACEVGTVTITTGAHDESSGSPETTVEDSTTGVSTSDTEGQTSQASSGATEAESTTGELLGCFQSDLGDFDLRFSGCCEQPIGTCTAWCEQQGLGPCVFVGVYATAGCADEGMYGGLCDVDPWEFFPEGPPSGIRCACQPS